MPLSPHEVDRFEASRARLEAIAYRLLGSASEAEDAVQETFLRWQAADRERIESPEAWLTKVLTNLCLNQLTSARARRETYVGQWLPEPVLEGDPMLGPAETAEQRESVSLAVLTLMERLSPVERGVYVLREAFSYPHAEIARILDITEANCQQIYHRAKGHVASGRTRAAVDRAAAHRIVTEFLAAADSGETEPLVRMLTADAISVGDGGGRIPARPRPIVGATAVAKFLRGLFKPADSKRALLGGPIDMYAGIANGSPALIGVVGGRVGAVMELDVADGAVAAVRSVVNPDKLVRADRIWNGAEPGEPLVRDW
ncbi:RNA polymerase sigma-70 factor [Glycomyces xiaoerkulensis]|uniref:RNA polymerase sigma-70 factor n=1 Tax=Glycomyces xiaoerkulensis TaxID=2038139 RepID=UPI000C257FF6|nr:RNA polymerase sigma-70 factor [Glycomyces xiaoerkulensis]